MIGSRRYGNVAELVAILLERIEGVRLCETILFRARCSRITS